MSTKITQYGFEFMAATVERLASHTNGSAIIGIKTPKAQMEIHVTPSGFLRIEKVLRKAKRNTTPGPVR